MRRKIVVHFSDKRTEIPVWSLADKAGVTLENADEAIANLVELGYLVPRADFEAMRRPFLMILKVDIDNTRHECVKNVTSCFARPGV